MKTLTTLITLVVITCSFAQQSFTHQLQSDYLGETRDLKIYIPPSYEMDSTRYYPLAVVLDAEYMFDAYVGNSVLFAQKEKAPEQIVVGISQKDRQRYSDCAYDKTNSMPIESSDNFYRFVRAELLNYLEANYRISPFKTIVGNTITANFTNYFFIEDSPGFNAFINLNPYFATDIPNMVVSETSKIKNNNYYYYMCSGSYLSSKRAGENRNVAEMYGTIANEKFKFKFDSFDGSDKVTSIGMGMANAMAHIFGIYAPISKEEFENTIKEMSPPDAIAYLENKYVEIEYQFGANLKIRERDIYVIEPIIIDKEEGEYLRDYGEMIFKLYPDSPLSDYYIGMDYEMRGKYKNALEAYKEGYMKITGSIEDADAFYKNIERVSAKVN